MYIYCSTSISSSTVMDMCKGTPEKLVTASDKVYVMDRIKAKEQE